MPNKEYYLEAAAGNEPANAEIIHKFGRNDAVGTTYTPISYGGIYRTPQVGSATKLRVKAGNVNDAPAGTGARAICMQGLLTDGTLVEEILTTNGTSAGPQSVNEYIRLYRAYVCESGTYATQSTGSHAAAIVIENAAGTEDWFTIDSNGFPASQTEIAAYTVPKGKYAYILDAKIHVDTVKTTSAIFFAREDILQTSAPYSAMRRQFGSNSITSTYEMREQAPMGPYKEFTDLGFLVKVDTGTAEVSAEFTILVRDKE